MNDTLNILKGNSFCFLSKKDKRKCIAQRAKHGFCGYDLTDMDYYLLNLIPDMLDAYAKESIGFPGTMSDREEWLDYLNGTSAKFRKAMRNIEEGIGADPKLLKEAFDALQEHFFSLWY